MLTIMWYFLLFDIACGLFGALLYGFFALVDAVTGKNK